MASINFYLTIDEIADYLAEKGINLPVACKRRDAKEPGRAIKERWEDRLYKLMRRYLRGQRKRLSLHLADRLAIRTMTVKATAGEIESSIPTSVWRDDGMDALLLILFSEALQDGVELAGDGLGVGIEWADVNTDAATFARNYVTDWLLALDEVTRNSLREAIATFIDTPGFTIGDVMDMLPFDDARALRIAVTEITRVFGRAELLAGLRLQELYPDLSVVKTWFTNNDDLVCAICGPLNGVRIPISDNFQSVVGEIECPPAHVNCRCWMSTRTVI